MEFFDAPPPSQAQAMALLGVSSVFSTFFLEKWIMNKYPRVASGVLGKAGELNTKGLIRRNLKWLIPVIVVIAAWALLWPMDVEVGGEAQVTTLKKNVAFCRMEGLIERTLVTEGELVEENQTLAILDPTELTYKIESARREYELLSKKLNTLSVESDTDLKKLAEAQLVKLRRKKIRNDLEFYEWQRQFLDIKAPTSGIVLTKDVQSITGKKLKAGEPFCELGKPSELAIDVFVPDNRAPKVEIGQELKVYLNNAPLDAHNLIVDRIAPATEVIPRLGNVCRVRAGFESPPQSAKIGMKGVGKISVGRSTPWELFRNSMAEKLNKLSLYF
jgi:multidrug resistance efflux pump